MNSSGRWRDPRAIVLAVCAFLAVGIALVGRAGFADAQAGISGSVFADTDGDGTWDTDELGQPGMAVWVIGETASVRVVTDQSGAFAADVSALGGGSFGVLVGELVGADGAPADPGSAAAVALPAGSSYSPIGASNGGAWTAPIGVGSTVVAGITTCGSCGPVTLGDRVWFDADSDGYQDLDEPPIGGAEVNVVSGGSVIGTTSTNADGRYSVGDEGAAGSVGLVIPGLRELGSVEISVRVTAEAAAAFGASGEVGAMELRATTPDGGFDAVDSDGGDTGPFTATAVTGTGTSNSDTDFGFRLVASEVTPTEPAVEPGAEVPPVSEPIASLPVETVPEAAPVEPPPSTEAPIDELPIEEPAVEQTAAARSAARESAAGEPAAGETAAEAAGTSSAARAAVPLEASPTTTAGTAGASPVAAQASTSTTGPAKEAAASKSASAAADDGAESSSDRNAVASAVIPRVLAAHVERQAPGASAQVEPSPSARGEDGSGAGDAISGDDVVVAVGSGKPPVLAERHPTTPVRFGGDVISGGALPRTGSTVAMILSFGVMLVGIGIVLVLGAVDAHPRTARVRVD